MRTDSVGSSNCELTVTFGSGPCTSGFWNAGTFMSASGLLPEWFIVADCGQPAGQGSAGVSLRGIRAAQISLRATTAARIFQQAALPTITESAITIKTNGMPSTSSTGANPQRRTD